MTSPEPVWENTNRGQNRMVRRIKTVVIATVVFFVTLGLLGALRGQTVISPQQLPRGQWDGVWGWVNGRGFTLTRLDVSTLSIDTTGADPVLKAIVPPAPTPAAARWQAETWDMGASGLVMVVYTLKSPPVPAESLMIFRNGILQQDGVDYMASGTSVRFLDVSRPTPGDRISARYTY